MRKVLPVLFTIGALLVSGTVAQAESHDTGRVPGPATAIELTTPTPAWYTDELHRGAVAAAANGQGTAIPADVNVPNVGLAFGGIRPGAWIISPSGCTANFVFGTPGDYYLGTAGHCTEVGDEVTIVAAPDLVMNIGRTVKSVDGGIGNDFALIKIHPEMQQHVNPSMAIFGGPTARGSAATGDLVVHVGHGLVVGTGGTPRAGAVVYRGAGDQPGSDAFAWLGLATPGDSGSAVRTLGGEAVGDLTHLIVGTTYNLGTVAGTSIERMLQIAGVPLATAPNGPDLGLS